MKPFWAEVTKTPTSASAAPSHSASGVHLTPKEYLLHIYLEHTVQELDTKQY